MPVDFDDIFKLATPKYVYIRDAPLGICKFAMMFLIFNYVVIYTVIMKCRHLPPHVANGFGHIGMTAPVEKCKDHTCLNDFDVISKLKYCIQDPVNQKDQKDLQRLLGDKKAKKDGKEGDSEEDGKEIEGEDADKDGKKKEEDEGKGGKKKEEDESKEKVSDKDEEDDIGKWITKPQVCRYIDHDRLTLQETPNQVFIPMRYTSYEQEMDPDCYDPNMKGFEGHVPMKEGSKAYACRKAWVTKSTKEFYVADIGHYTLSMQHSFMSPEIGLSGASTGFQGFVAACPTNHPTDVMTECKRMKIPNTSGDVAPEDIATVVKPADLGITSLTGTKDGLDEISLEDLLKLAPVAQQKNWTTDVPDRKFPKAFGHPDTSIRESGGMMMLTVSYDNTGHWRPGFPGLDMMFGSIGMGAIKPITYTYRPYFVPTKANKRVEVQQASDKVTHRVVNIWYGVTVQYSFEGKLVEFSFAGLLKALTTGLVLLSSATTIVIYFALYVAKYKDKYLGQMYQFTEDMSNYKKLDHKKEAVSSWSADKMLLAAEGKLTLDDIQEIMIDTEIRLNRLDGRDPQMAFPMAEDPADKTVDEKVKKLRKKHDDNLDKWFEQKSGGQPYQPLAQGP